MANKRLYMSDNNSYWYDLESGEIDGRPGKFHHARKERLKTHAIRTDNLPGGVGGMLSHADGKRYDSRSNYEKAVKMSGCVVVGNDWNNKYYKRPEVRGDFNVREQMRPIVNNILNRG